MRESFQRERSDKQSYLDQMKGLVEQVRQDSYRPREGEQGIGGRARRLSRNVAWLDKAVAGLEECGFSGDLRLERVRWLCGEAFERLSKLGSSSRKEDWDRAIWLCEKLVEEVGFFLRGSR